LTQKLYQRTENEEGRFYYCGEQNFYPSVTTFLNYVLDKSDLDSWRAWVGETEANRITKQSTDRGTELHHLCEQYLLGTPVETKYPMVKTMFKQLKPHLDKITNIKGLELSLHSDKLRLAGTADCVADYEDVPSIIDFKNSNQQKSEDDILGYFIQTTLYSVMVKERLGLDHLQLVILMACQTGRTLVFKKRVKDYLPVSLELLKKFYRENSGFKNKIFV